MVETREEIYHDCYRFLSRKPNFSVFQGAPPLVVNSPNLIASEKKSGRIFLFFICSDGGYSSVLQQISVGRINVKQEIAFVVRSSIHLSDILYKKGLLV